jgi:hypothetical protein
MKNKKMKRMFGADFDADGLREKLNELKDKVSITKEEDGIVLIFTDPDMLNDPSTNSFFSPSGFESLKSMIPGGEGLSYEVEPVEGGVKFKTSDPDALYDLLQKIFDPDFLINMMQQLMSAFMGPGGLMDSLKDIGKDMEGLGLDDPEKSDDNDEG